MWIRSLHTETQPIPYPEAQPAPPSPRLQDSILSLLTFIPSLQVPCKAPHRATSLFQLQCIPGRFLTCSPLPTFSVLVVTFSVLWYYFNGSIRDKNEDNYEVLISSLDNKKAFVTSGVVQTENFSLRMASVHKCVQTWDFGSNCFMLMALKDRYSVQW